MQLNWHILEMPTGYKSSPHLPSLLVYLASVQAYTFAPFFSFFVFFAMEILFLAPSNGIKKPKAKMKIKAKKTNSTSENTIQSSYFVLELRKLFFFIEMNSFAWVPREIENNIPSKKSIPRIPRANKEPNKSNWMWIYAFFVHQ